MILSLNLLVIISTACSAGYISSSGSCEACPTGSYSLEGDTSCTLCDEGTYTDVVGSSSCESCPGGYVPNFNASDCTMCSPSEYAPEYSSYCLLCPMGTYSSYPDEECYSCPSGTYASEEGSLYCDSCSAGSIPNAAQDACVKCKTGKWADEGDSSCSSCGSGCKKCTSKSECAVCQSDYNRELDEGTGYYTCSPKPKNPEKAATKSTAVSLGATSAVAKSISSGSSGALGFGVVAKVIRNARYFSIEYSNKTQETFAAEGSSSFELNAPSSFDDIESKELNGNFAKYDVEPNFLINYWGNLIPILILCGCFIVLKILKKYLGQSRGKILTHKVVIMIQISAGNYLVNSLYGSFDEIVLYFILEIQTCAFNSALSWMSFICALAFLIIGIGFFVFHFKILKKYQAAKSNGSGAQDQEEKGNEKRLEKFKAQHAYVKVLFEDFKDDSLAQQSFLASFMIRASLLNVLLCLFVDSPLIQAFLYLGVNLVFALFLVIKRPYEELKGAAAQYFCEAIILVTYSCALVLALMDHNGSDAESLRGLLEKIIVLLGIGLNVGGTVFQCLDIFIGVCLYVKSFKVWRARLKIARAPVGAVSKAAGNPDLTFMKVKSGLKIEPSKEEDGGLISRSGSPTRLISRNLDTEMERFSLPSTNSTRKHSTIVFTGESQDDLDYHKRTTVFEINRESEIRLEERSRIGRLNSPSIRRRTSTIVFTGESQNDLDYHKRTGVFEITLPVSEERNHKNITSYSIRKTNSTIVFTGEAQYDPDYHKKTDVFEIDPPENATKGEERDGRKRIVTEPDRIEKEGEAFGDLMVFDYENSQKVNNGKETFRGS